MSAQRRETVIEQAYHALADIAERDVSLAGHTTYRVGGAAAIMVRPRIEADLVRIARVCRESRLAPLVVGRGSNLLVADEGFHGIAISLASLATAIDIEGAIEGAVVRAGGAVALPQLARRLAAACLTGFEWAVGVPGSVGGAVRMNAGGHGSDIAASLIAARIFDFRTELVSVKAASELGLRFRSSDLTDDQIVLDARLQLSAGDRQRSEHLIDDIVKWRRENQPGGQNAGSVFVNPIPGQLSAGELIDRAGLRGMTLGSATVSAKHANFIQGSDDGNAGDVRALIDFVRQRVFDETGFMLRSEVRLVGFGGEE